MRRRRSRGRRTFGRRGKSSRRRKKKSPRNSYTKGRQKIGYRF